MSPLSELDLAVSSLIAQGMFLSLLFLGTLMIIRGGKKANVYPEDLPYSLYVVLVAALLISGGILALSPALFDRWSPMFGAPNLYGPEIHIAISLLLGLDILTVAFFVWKTGTSHDSPFSSLYFLIPVLAVLLRQPALTVWLMALVVAISFTVTSFEREPEIMSVGWGLRPLTSGFVVIASFALATWLGITTVPSSEPTYWWPTYSVGTPIPMGKVVSFNELVRDPRVVSPGANIYLTGQFQVIANEAHRYSLRPKDPEAAPGKVSVLFPVDGLPLTAGTEFTRRSDAPLRVRNLTRKPGGEVLIQAEEVFAINGQESKNKMSPLAERALYAQLGLQRTPEVDRLVIEAVEGAPRALFECGTLFYVTDPSIGLLFIEHAALKGFGPAIDWLIDAFTHGRLGVKADSAMSQFWWDKRLKK